MMTIHLRIVGRIRKAPTNRAKQTTFYKVLLEISILVGTRRISAHILSCRYRWSIHSPSSRTVFRIRLKTEKGQLKGYLSMNRVLAESGIKKIPIGVKLQVTVIPLPLDLQHAN
jgi:hypothetical protein